VTSPDTAASAAPGLGDARARQAITERLDTTLFVEAGAGSGKTQSLVNRVLATVLNPAGAVALRHIAAVTFTEKAAVELRGRLRAAFEQRRAAGPTDSVQAALAGEALDDLDTAAIGTLHSFAQRILTEHPIEAGLPPLVEVGDEVASGVAFDNRWAALRAEMLDDPNLAAALPLAMAAGMRLDDLRSMASAFTDHWDLLAERVLATAPGDLPPLDTDPLVHQARRLVNHAEHCADDDDRFLAHLTELARWADRLAEAPDDPARLAVLGDARQLKWSFGRRGNWSCDLSQLKDQCAQLAAEIAAVRERVLDAALRRLARRVGEATLQAAQARREEGRLEFHDLLVLSRNLLRDPRYGPAVRTVLQRQYRRQLLDEFQDTDPIQVELAVRIAGGASADAADWAGVRIPAGALFVVGDPKQSIYRFRRADIATYLHAQQRIGTPVALDTNFRTGAPILDWVNHVFGRLITASTDSQPAYHPLRSHRAGAPGGPPVLALGVDAHADGPSAEEIRAREAVDVATVVRTALAERWQVADEHGGWRDVRLPDIAILVPARTSLPHLETALDAAGIGYHAGASSLVYRTREVRELLTAARAADDPSDQLTLITTLRSPLFGCGDDDLWTWHQARGRWNILAPAPQAVPVDHPVAQAVEYLKRLHNDRTWLSPSEVLTRLVDDRRILEVAADHRRSRDIWRRLRFVVDQARAWSDTEHGGLRGYLTWATRQGSEAARVAEAVLPETDTDTLRIMTIHSAKGLEFPVVIVTGMSSRAGHARRGIDVIWPRAGGYELRLRKDLQTGQFDVAQPIDEQMSHHERLRLLYVACTRARDHLVVSLHRRTRPSNQAPEDRNLTNAELLAGPCTAAPHMATLAVTQDGRGSETPTRPRLIQPPPPFPQWLAAMSTLRARAAQPSAVSASQLEGTARNTPPRAAATNGLGEPDDPGLAKDARDLELPPWNKGRYGTAIGRAVHGVLQTVDLATGDGLDDAVAAQVLAEGVADYTGLVTQLVQAALASHVVKYAATRPHWRETYAGTVVGERVLEGVIDLLYRDHRGLVIVDYKTDAVPAAALDARVDHYRPQMAAYALAVAAATGEAIPRCVLLFLTPFGAHERGVADVSGATADVRETVRAGTAWATG
jgi:ATP-dependent exoDNAse (exonuclease V) beta subunit